MFRQRMFHKKRSTNSNKKIHSKHAKSYIVKLLKIMKRNFAKKLKEQKRSNYNDEEAFSKEDFLYLIEFRLNKSLQLLPPETTSLNTPSSLELLNAQIEQQDFSIL